VPRRTGEPVHGVSFPLGRAAALGAGRVDEFRDVRQWRAAVPRWLILLHLRQAHRKLILGHRNHPARSFAIDHRDRTSPVALTRDGPIAHPVADGRPADLVVLRVLADRANRCGGRHPVQKSRINRDSLIGEGPTGRHRTAIGGGGKAPELPAPLPGRIVIAPILTPPAPHPPRARTPPHLPPPPPFYPPA